MAILTVWMEIEAHQFDPFASKLTWEQAIKPIYGLETDQVVVKENEANLEKVLDIYEKRLGKYRFLACNTFTLADLHHLPNIQYLLGTPTNRLFEDRPKVLKWVGEITGREAWKMACDHEKYWFDVVGHDNVRNQHTSFNSLKLIAENVSTRSETLQLVCVVVDWLKFHLNSKRKSILEKMIT
ncbi:hypothetical protein F2Q70_00042185 [Brassica cretica]|uniref:glutathione transferase n=1 Tax=Brassica cretica TaxID=69181 RepID=A0A8S9K6N0_BRACR|nr:hypothetical protein F2Q70_00042185 [Brassica cretica]